MAGKRLYVTIHPRDYKLIQRVAMLAQECASMWARRIILTALYEELLASEELRDYNIELAQVEREEVIHHGR